MRYVFYSTNRYWVHIICHGIGMIAMSECMQDIAAGDGMTALASGLTWLVGAVGAFASRPVEER